MTDESGIIRFPPQPEAPLIQEQKVLSRDTLGEYVEESLVRNARKLLRKMYKNIEDRLEKGDSRAVREVGEMYGLLKGNGGVIINNLVSQVNLQANSDAATFESIIRKLEDRDRPSGPVIDVRSEEA